MNKIPQAVYLDTNSVRELSFGVSNVDFLKLKELCKKFNILVGLPETAALEWKAGQLREVQEEISRIKSSKSKIDLLLNIQQEKYSEPQSISEALSKKIISSLNEAGLKFIVTSNKINLMDVVVMAVDRRPPFEPKTAGYKKEKII